MAFLVNPSPGDRGEPDSRSQGGGRGSEIRPSPGKSGVHVLAHGALVCPGCDVPIVISESIPAGRLMTCGACGTEARAHELVARDVFDTVANEVYVVGRVPPERRLRRRPRARRA